MIFRLAATHAAVPTTHPLHGVMSATFLCHHCNDGIQPWGLTCELCHFNVDINQQPSNADVNETVKRQAQAFHQIKKAKWRLRRPDESGNKFVSREVRRSESQKVFASNSNTLLTRFDRYSSSSSAAGQLSVATATRSAGTAIDRAVTRGDATRTGTWTGPSITFSWSPQSLIALS